MNGIDFIIFNGADAGFYHFIPPLKPGGGNEIHIVQGGMIFRVSIEFGTTQAHIRKIHSGSAVLPLVAASVQKRVFCVGGDIEPKIIVRDAIRQGSAVS